TLGCDRLRRSMIEALHRATRHAFDALAIRRAEVAVLPVRDRTVGQEVVPDDEVGEAVRAEVSLVHEDEAVDQGDVRAERAERRPPDEAAPPVPVDPGRAPDAARDPDPPRCGREAPAPVVEGPRPGLVRHPRPAVGAPGPVAVDVRTPAVADPRVPDVAVP